MYTINIEHNKHAEERLDKNLAKGLSVFRTENESGIDVEYRKVRLERVILVSVWSNALLSEKEAIYSVDELERLANTAGAEVLARVMQQRPLPDNATYVGKGKAQELAGLVKELDADTIITNETLAPSTRRALEDIVQVKVVDRTALILDIFASHAKSKAGKAQVELAQLQYLLPRLRGWGKTMSRQAGGQVGGGVGIGSRGPGETQLEVDRRRINTKISLLKAKIKKITYERSVTNAKRNQATIPAIAIVGYTNAGKSSLLNALTGADIIIQDALFATLDTTTRQVKHPKFVITDTVGFIQDLPTTLVEAFRSTLEETANSDIILHIVDASSPNPQLQIDTVNEILADIRSADENGKVILKDREYEILAFNKIDLLENAELERLKRKYPHAVFISIKNNRGVDDLICAIEKKVLSVPQFKEISEIIPYNDGKRLAKIYHIGEVLTRQDLEIGTQIKARVPEYFV